MNNPDVELSWEHKFAVVSKVSCSNFLIAVIFFGEHNMHNALLKHFSSAVLLMLGSGHMSHVNR
jgi:hypothetical protein